MATLKSMFDRIAIWFWTKLDPCRIGWDEYDHDWVYHSDWYGDPDVIGGTADCGYWECQYCKEIDTDREPPGPSEDVEYRDHRANW